MIEFQSSPEDRPTVEQLQQYRDLLVDVLHRQGRDIKYAVHYGKNAHVRADTEYLMPRTLTNWTKPQGEKKRIKAERDRAYAASFRRMGEGAARLLVIEHENQLVEVPDFNSDSNDIRFKKMYDTNRRLYRFTYSPLVGLYEAEVQQSQIMSSPGTNFEVVSADELGVTEVALLDHENTVANDPSKEYTKYGTDWNNVTVADFTELLERTRQYGVDYDAAHPVYKAS